MVLIDSDLWKCLLELNMADAFFVDLCDFVT